MLLTLLSRGHALVEGSHRHVSVLQHPLPGNGNNPGVHCAPGASLQLTQHEDLSSQSSPASTMSFPHVALAESAAVARQKRAKVTATARNEEEGGARVPIATECTIV